MFGLSRRWNFTSHVRYSMARWIHAGLLPHSSCFGFDPADFGIFFFPTVWLCSEGVFLELLAFAISVRQGTVCVRWMRDCQCRTQLEACNKFFYFYYDNNLNI